MPAGRRLLIKQGGTAIAGCTQTSITITGEPIDTTDKQSGGWRTLDDDVGLRSVDISLSGYSVGGPNVFRTALTAATATLKLTDITVEYDDGETLSGDFWLGSVEESGNEGSEAMQYSAELQSSGPITRTPAV